MFNVRATLLTVAPSGMASLTSKAKRALLADPLLVISTNRCGRDPLLVKLLEAWYRVLSLLGFNFTVRVTSSNCGSSVAGTSVGIGSRVAAVSWASVGAGVAVEVGTGALVASGATTGSAVAAGTSVSVGAGVSVELIIDDGIVVAAGAVVAVGTGPAAGAEVAAEPQATANKTTTTDIPAIKRLIFLGPSEHLIIWSLTLATRNPAEDYLCHAWVNGC